MTSQRTPGRLGNLRAASYARRSDSKGKRNDERSVEEQEEGNVHAANSSGWYLPASRRYKDNDISASRYSTKARPEWDRLESNLNAGLIDVLIVWETSRAWRKLSEWVLLVDICRDNGVLIHVTSHHHTYDPTKRRDRKTLIEEGVDSEDETEKTSERVKRAMEANARAGKPHSRPAYGYEIQLDPRNPRLKVRVIVPEEAAIVREVLKRVAASHPIVTIVRDLNSRGVDSPSVAQARREGKELPEALWSPAMIRKLCSNVVYIGKRAFLDEIEGREILVDGDWDSIAGEELFWSAYNLIREPSRKTTKPGRQKHLLSFVAQCGACGSFVTRMGGGGGAQRYKCSSPQSCVTIRMDWVDGLISELICQRLAKPDIWKELTETGDEEKEALYAELEGLRAAHAEALDLRAKGKLSLLALSREEERILPRIDEIDRALKPQSIPQAIENLTSGVTEEPSERLKELRSRWAKLGEDGPAAQKDVIRTLVEFIKIQKSNVLGRILNEEQKVQMLKHRVKVKWRNE